MLFQVKALCDNKFIWDVCRLDTNNDERHSAFIDDNGVNKVSLRGSQLPKKKKKKKKKKVDSLHVPAIKIYRVEAVGLYLSKYTFIITIFVNMWYLEQFREDLIFC